MICICCMHPAVLACLQLALLRVKDFGCMMGLVLGQDKTPFVDLLVNLKADKPFQHHAQFHAGSHTSNEHLVKTHSKAEALNAPLHVHDSHLHATVNVLSPLPDFII